MAIRCNLSTLMGKKRYQIKDVHEKTGLARNTISKLYNDRATRIDYATIDKICTLFNCSIGDLLVKVDKTESSNHNSGKEESV